MKQALRVAFGFPVLWASVLHAEVRIMIDSGIGSNRPISVVPFQWAEPDTAPEGVSGIVTTDLRNGGKFNPLDRARLPQQPGSAQGIQPAAWPVLDTDTVAVGQVTPNPGGSYNVAYQLVNTGDASNTVLSQNSYEMNKQWLRYIGYTASNEVFEKLTGVKDAFYTRIAYVVQTNSDQLLYELRVSDCDSYNQFIVHRSPQPLMSPARSPDGSKLAYVAFKNDRSALVIQTLANGAVRQAASFPCHNGTPIFSPDDSKLIFASSKTGSPSLYVVDLIFDQIRQVIDGCNNSTEPTWFPGSQDLVFTSDQAGRPQVYKTNISGSTPQRITREGPQNQDANVSNDDKFMVIASSNDGQQHIVKQDLVTGGVQVLSSTFLDETLSLAPSGTMVVYSPSQGIGPTLNLVSTNGRFKAHLPTTGGQVKFPAQSPYLR